MPIFQNSVISFPDRGPWGDKSFRGNTSGWIVKGFLERWHLDPQLLFVDPMQGSGTSRDVARDMGIRYMGLDLSTGFNILKNDLLSVVGEQPLSAFLHPPYKDMIKYSENPDDLSSKTNVNDFLEAAYTAVMNVWHALRVGGTYAILMGNMRKAGKFYPLASMLEAIVPGDQLEQLVKIQHNTTSGRGFYGNANFVPIMHETLLVFRKPEHLALALDWSIELSERQAFRHNMTWRTLVRMTMMQKPDHVANLTQLYEAIEGSPKAKGNQNWQAKVRQVVQTCPEFNRVAPATYQMGFATVQ